LRLSGHAPEHQAKEAPTPHAAAGRNGRLGGGRRKPNALHLFCGSLPEEVGSRGHPSVQSKSFCQRGAFAIRRFCRFFALVLRVCACFARLLRLFCAKQREHQRAQRKSFLNMRAKRPIRFLHRGWGTAGGGVRAKTSEVHQVRAAGCLRPGAACSWEGRSSGSNFFELLRQMRNFGRRLASERPFSLKSACSPFSARHTEN
jgi:hypothetical protein